MEKEIYIILGAPPPMDMFHHEIIFNEPQFFGIGCSATQNFEDFTNNAQPYYQIPNKAMHPHFLIPDTLFGSCNNIWF